VGKSKTSRKNQDILGSRFGEIKIWLDQTLKEFHHLDFLDTDPISIVHRYPKAEDQEVAALVAALFSFGNVRAIKNVLESVLGPLGSTPRDSLLLLTDRDFENISGSTYYRFYRGKDISLLLRGLRNLISNHGSIAEFLRSHWRGDIFDLLQTLRAELLQVNQSRQVSRGLRFMYADPHAGAAKRWHMLMRWMVRKDQIDLGLWNFIPTSALIQPLDVHLFEVSRGLGLTKLKSPSRKAALEITECFRKWDPTDPIKYDFALCRLGILGLKNDLFDSQSLFSRP